MPLAAQFRRVGLAAHPTGPFAVKRPLGHLQAMGKIDDKANDSHHAQNSLT